MTSWSGDLPTGSTDAAAKSGAAVTPQGSEASDKAKAPTSGKAATTDATKAATKAADSSAAKVAGAGEPAAVVDRIKAVPKKPLLKRKRVELAPFISLSLNDSYVQHLAAAGSLVFYPHDSFGIGVGVHYLYAHLDTDNVDVMRKSQTAVQAPYERPRMFAHMELHWVPLYGKLSLFDSTIVHFDGYVAAGFGVATAFGTRRPPLATAAIGQRFVIADWMALRVELRDFVYIDTQTVNGLPRSDIQNFVMLMLGVSFFVPPTFEYSYR